MQLSLIAATLEGCPYGLLNDAELIGRLVDQAVSAAKLTLLHSYVHRLSPQGVTAAAVLTESHIAVHTWPELGLLFVDIATCTGDAATQAAFDRIRGSVPHSAVLRRHWGIPIGDRLSAEGAPVVPINRQSGSER